MNKQFTLLRFLGIILTSVLSISSWATEFHVTTAGTTAGTGSLTNPWNLQKGLNESDKIKPGDTLTIHEGRYVGNFTTQLNGTADKYILVRGEQGKRVILDGNTGVSNFGHGSLYAALGAYTIYKDLILTNSNPNRTSAQTGSDPKDIVQNAGLYVDVSQGLKFINLIVCDAVGNGVSIWKAAKDCELYGCIVFNNGWHGPDRGHGHGVYTQNSLNSQKLITNNVFFNNFAFGIKVYSTGSDRMIDDYTIENNTSFNNGSLEGPENLLENIFVGGYKTGSANIQLNNNSTYVAPEYTSYNVTLGYLGESEDIVCKGNYFVGGVVGVDLQRWSHATFENNTISGTSQWAFRVFESVTNANPTYKIDNNQYNNYQSKASYLPFMDYSLDKQYSFSEWKSLMNVEANSIYTTTKPSKNVIFLTPNEYEKGRAHATIYNWEKLENVSLNLDGIVEDGNEYKIYDVQNILGQPIAEGIYTTGKSVNVKMNLSTTQIPNGKVPFVPGHTSIEFGSYLIVSTPVAPKKISTNISALKIRDYSQTTTSDLIEINFTTQNASDMLTAQVYSLSGKMLSNETKAGNKGENQFEINLAELPTGFYIVKISDGLNTASCKILKKAN